MPDTTLQHRTPNYPIDSIFINRWSPRAFDSSNIPDEDLQTILEAARWAPSAFNVQPWRFVYSHRGDEHWNTQLNLLDPFNKSWAQNASALVYVISDKIVSGDGTRPDKPSNYNSFDAGAAWAQLALQASVSGYKAHAMAGLYFDKAQEALKLPERYKVEIAVAIGKNTTPNFLAPVLQEREIPSQRLASKDIIFAGTFS
ncbi:nitroreductase family protein [Kiloniella majae]|uniref:nitroreductase family protein n=1 Tax=Kiloniella majae TaxID=1938558 RepID=UPI000A277DAE|nr:nitroreductase family protein [Kiloniella majae]